MEFNWGCLWEHIYKLGCFTCGCSIAEDHVFSSLSNTAVFTSSGRGSFMICLLTVCHRLNHMHTLCAHGCWVVKSTVPGHAWTISLYRTPSLPPVLTCFPPSPPRCALGLSETDIHVPLGAQYFTVILILSTWPFMGLPTSTAHLESKLLLPQQTDALIYVGTA